ncbi:hypothetical protein PINS_up020623 [Pythium insidiosum]|nr:hypothetical protein PINS_up020623 [Pythium insidiosum]
MSCEDGLSYPRRAVLEILRRVGHQLRCLRIEPRLEYTFLDAEFADALMLHCPRLEELQVKCVDATFVDRLLNGYRDRRCFLSTLDIEVRDTEVASLSNLLNALKDPRHAVTTTLQQLVVRVKRVRSTEFPQDLAHAIIEMLQVNHELWSLRVVPSIFDRDILAQFEALPSKYTRQTMTRRHRAALLSVLHRFGQRDFPSEALGSVFDLCARPVWRFW